MKVIFFGSYDKTEPRNCTLTSSLKKSGIEVIECHSSIKDEIRSKTTKELNILSLAKFIIRSLQNYFKLLKKHLRQGYDIMLVGYPGYFDVFLARILTKMRKKPLVFSPHISLYDTVVFDRGLVKKTSLKARLLHTLDKYSCTLPEAILLDTNQHIEYFHKEFGIPREKFRRIFIGADDEMFYPREIAKNEYFTVLFQGSFIPLHGLEYIVKAAKLLEEHKDIKFEIIGSGQTFEKIRQLSDELHLKNVAFLGWKEHKNMPSYIAAADVCLGIFGNTDKAKRVIPVKAFEALAMGKPLITMDSPAAREVFTNGENVILCKRGNPKAIAESILLLKNNKALREKIAKNGYTLYKERFSLHAIGEEIKKVMNETIQHK